HYKTIEKFATDVSKKHGKILKSNRFRIGTAQKFINLYWKLAWLSGKISTLPIHCPFDSIIINHLPGNVRASWTRMDSIEKYKKWVSAARMKANNGNTKATNAKKLAEWELEIYWNSLNKDTYVE